jgi:hypothetical protein
MHTHLLWSVDALEHYLVDMPRDLDSWELWKRYNGLVLDLLVANGLMGLPVTGSSPASSWRRSITGLLRIPPG